MSKRAKYSVDNSQEVSFWEKREGADLKHNHFVRELQDLGIERLETQPHITGPLIEKVYPKDFPAEGWHEEGELDVYLESADRIVVYEIKNRNRKGLKKALSQYQRAQNFFNPTEKEFDFNIVLISDTFEEIQDALQKSGVSTGYLNAIDEAILKEELETVTIADLIKGGALSKFEWLESGYRDIPGDPPRFDFDYMVEEELVNQEEHIYIASDKLLDTLESREEQLLYLSPFWDNFYGEDQIDELLDDTLEGL